MQYLNYNSFVVELQYLKCSNWIVFMLGVYELNFPFSSVLKLLLSNLSLLRVQGFERRFYTLILENLPER